jgi:hypothetical protein
VLKIFEDAASGTIFSSNIFGKIDKKTALYLHKSYYTTYNYCEN